MLKQVEPCNNLKKLHQILLLAILMTMLWPCLSSKDLQSSPGIGKTFFIELVAKNFHATIQIIAKQL